MREHPDLDKLATAEEALNYIADYIDGPTTSNTSPRLVAIRIIERLQQGDNAIEALYSIDSTIRAAIHEHTTNP